MIKSKSLRGGENPSFTWGKPVGQHGSLSSSNSVLVAWCKTVFTRVDPLRKKLERTSYSLADILSVIGNYVKNLSDNIN